MTVQGRPRVEHLSLQALAALAFRSNDAAPPIVAIPPRALETLRWLAVERGAPKRAANVATEKVDAARSDYEIDYLGVRAEYAVARYLGVPFACSTGIRGDGGVTDLWLGSLRIQVKATAHKTGRLLFKRAADFQADAAVLVIERGEADLELRGWIYRDEFTVHHEMRDFGYGKNATFDQENLMPMPDLLARVELERIDLLLWIEGGYARTLDPASDEARALQGELHKWRARGKVLAERNKRA